MTSVSALTSTTVNSAPGAATFTGDAEQLADQAAPLDALLVQATRSPLRRFVPTASTAKFAAALVRHPRRTGRQVRDLAGEFTRVVAGSSTITPSRRDRRFTDTAWSDNPALRRLVQAYLATGQAAEDLVSGVDLDWRDAERVRFMVSNLIEAMAPSNVPLVNPSSAKAAIDTAGLSLLRGAGNLAGDLVSAPRVPAMVDTSGFEVGRNLAATAGAVVLRTELLELIQYAPQTELVRRIPLLIVPPTINKHYALDLAPGRSLVEYLVQQGQQVFMISWRNPDGRHAKLGLDDYVNAVLEAMDAVERVSGTQSTALAGVCSGGIIASLAAAHLAGTSRLHRLAAFTLLVTVLDNDRAGTSAALVDESMAAAAKAMSRRRGYLDGRALAEVFAWLRPGDLIWNYWVNNYLLGKRPPAFDILFWNADTTRMTAQLHADFIDIALGNGLVSPGAVTVLDAPVDLSSIRVDSYLVAGIADHITPWQNCYRTTQLLGGETRFVLSSSGHIAALVNPPTNPKATFQVSKETSDDAHQWLQSASTEKGSWWPDFADWLSDRCGSTTAAPEYLGGGGLRPLAEAPGTYVFEN